MTSRRGPLCAWFFLLLWSGCVSFRLTIPDLPEAVVDYAVFTATLPAGGEYDTPPPVIVAGIRPVALYSVVRILGLSRPAVVRWRWYSPQRKLVRESPPLGVNGKGKNLEYVVAWDRLPEMDWQAGRWTVEIRLDDRCLTCCEVELTPLVNSPAATPILPAGESATTG